MSILGTDGTDSLIGTNSAETLNGDQGNDTLDGSDGNDTYLFKTGDGNDTISNYTGTYSGQVDTVQFTNINPDAITSITCSNGSDFVLRYSATDSITFTNQGSNNYLIDKFIFADGTTWTIDQLYQNKALSLTANADTINLDDGVSKNINALAGNDYIDAGTGNDTLNGGLGNDTLDGSDGNDIYLFKTGDGNDTISNYTGTYSGQIDTVQFTDINAVDILNMQQVDSNLYIQYATDSSITIDDNFASTNYQIDQIKFADGKTYLYSQILVGTNNAETLSGSASNNLIFGNNGNDSISGGAGDDVLHGNGGGDVLDGGEGNDSVSYISSEASIAVSLNTSLAQDVGGGAGVDTLLGIENVAGSKFDDTLTGSGGDNILYGGEGNDLINGLSGNDTLNGGTGVDTVTYSLATSSISIDLQKTYAQAIGGNSGTDLLINIENISGSAYADKLTGNSASNTLNGAAGADTLTGSDGSDIYYVDNAGDIVSETNAVTSMGGTDTVYSTLSSYALTANVENGRIIASSSANLVGNTLDNVLFAGAGNNVLNGSSGTDTVNYQYATAAVNASLAITTAQATSGSGSDTFLNIENLSGSAYADKLTGNSASNTLNGGIGADSLTGGNGSDTFYFSSLTDLGLGITRDVITDFNNILDKDKIDLSAIDANTVIAGDQSFSLVTSGFTAAGQISYNAGIISINTDSDAPAEYEIQLTGIAPTTLTITDLIL